MLFSRRKRSARSKLEGIKDIINGAKCGQPTYLRPVQECLAINTRGRGSVASLNKMRILCYDRGRGRKSESDKDGDKVPRPIPPIPSGIVVVDSVQQWFVGWRDAVTMHETVLYG